MFKIGQRVVFVDCAGLPRHPLVIYPELHEVVTIGDLFIHSLSGQLIIVTKEYPNPIFGDVNGIVAICFRPIDEAFAEGVLKNIAEEIQEEELICLK